MAWELSCKESFQDGFIGLLDSYVSSESSSLYLEVESV